MAGAVVAGTSGEALGAIVAGTSGEVLGAVVAGTSGEVLDAVVAGTSGEVLDAITLAEAPAVGFGSPRNTQLPRKVRWAPVLQTKGIRTNAISRADNKARLPE